MRGLKKCFIEGPKTGRPAALRRFWVRVINILCFGYLEVSTALKCGGESKYEDEFYYTMESSYCEKLPRLHFISRDIEKWTFFLFKP